MCKQEQDIRTPQSNLHKENTPRNNVCRNRRNFSVNSPACWIINITNFQNFQIINSSNLAISQSNKNKSKKSIIYPLPKNCSFSLKCVNWRNSCQTDHQYSPSKCGCCRTLIQTFQIPKILRTSPFLTQFLHSVPKGRTYYFLHQQSPNTKIHNNVKNHISPLNTNNSIIRRILKDFISLITHPSLAVRIDTKRHKNLSNMTNTTISKQSFQICLSQRGNRTNNHRKTSKKGQCISKV